MLRYCIRSVRTLGPQRQVAARARLAGPERRTGRRGQFRLVDQSPVPDPRTPFRNPCPRWLAHAFQFLALGHLASPVSLDCLALLLLASPLMAVQSLPPAARE